MNNETVLFGGVGLFIALITIVFSYLGESHVPWIMKFSVSAIRERELNKSLFKVYFSSKTVLSSFLHILKKRKFIE